MSDDKVRSPRTRLTSEQVRQGFLDFFAERGHTIVPSSSLVPADDPTLLFTNAGMVQFKDVFLGTGTRPYKRAANSQKCMRVAGKHNDLEDVGRDDYHHTFFEMLGNWSFGDYYKKEAIAWAWELLTELWGLPKERLYATCFEDELGEIPRDDEAAEIWAQQPGFDPSHILFFGRKENFWEMAETGPCGPDTEIHYDRGPEFCDRQDDPRHVCQVNGDCHRFLELWNLVFIQYNRKRATELEPLPAKHVDTGMGFERILAVLQGVDSNYKTDLFQPIFQRIQELAGHSDAEREALLTPYRVIADHSRAAAFLIADGVVPGNTGRNYVCRMIIRRAHRFGNKAGFDAPFLADVAEAVIEKYGQVYPELARSRSVILSTLMEEERRFRRTLDAGLDQLEDLLERLAAAGETTLPGEQAFELYATYGLPLELTRDVAGERRIGVDEAGFRQAMEAHRLASGAGTAAGAELAQQAERYRRLLESLQEKGLLGPDGVQHDPYGGLETEGSVLALLREGETVDQADEGDRVEVVLPETHFYVEAGGQVSDTGTIVSAEEPRWEIQVEDVHRPVEGLVVHVGTVKRGRPRQGDRAIAAVDAARRRDTMRNHTATHLLHAALRAVLGEHARQAGSLVAPDRLRFDFTHPQALSQEQLEAIETWVNDAILANYRVRAVLKPREEAIAEGAIALFGEAYDEIVRTIQIGAPEPISYELCGGTHVPETAVIGPFVILSESSAAAGIRRIEALTGRAAIAYLRRQAAAMKRMALRLGVPPDEVENRVTTLLEETERLERERSRLRAQLAEFHFRALQPTTVDGVVVLAGEVPGADAEVLRRLADRFREEHKSGVLVLASRAGDRPMFIAAVTQDLVARGLHAGELVKAVASVVGGGGGGKPTLAQAGGKDASKVPEALAQVAGWVRQHLT